MTTRNNDVRADESDVTAGSNDRRADVGATTKPRKRGKREKAFEGAEAVSATDETAQPVRKLPTNGSPDTKANLVLGKLRTPDGVSIANLIAATGWQAHSVRGFLSGTVKTKLALPLVSEIGKDGMRRYRIVGDRVLSDDETSNSVATEIAK